MSPSCSRSSEEGQKEAVGAQPRNGSRRAGITEVCEVKPSAGSGQEEHQLFKEKVKIQVPKTATSGYVTFLHVGEISRQ